MTPIYLDRIVSSDDLTAVFTAPTVTYVAGLTTWTLPYTLATDDSEGTLLVVLQTTGTGLAPIRPAANTVALQGDYRDIPVWIGVPYTSTVTLSALFPRDTDGVAETRGRLNVRYLRILYTKTTFFIVTVTAVGRAARTYQFSVADPEDGVFLVPIQCRNVDATVTITIANASPCNITGYTWEGQQHIRGRFV